MKDLAAEFRAVSELYRELREKLAAALSVNDPMDSRTLAESILRNRDCLVKTVQMNSRVTELSNEWKKRRSCVDATSQHELDCLAEVVRKQAMRLRELCDFHAQNLQAAHDRLEKKLTELRKGSRYLKSIKPIKNNYPKFIDSTF